MTTFPHLFAWPDEPFYLQGEDGKPHFMTIKRKYFIICFQTAEDASLYRQYVDKDLLLIKKLKFDKLHDLAKKQKNDYKMTGLLLIKRPFPVTKEDYKERSVVHYAS